MNDQKDPFVNLTLYYGGPRINTYYVFSIPFNLNSNEFGIKFVKNEAVRYIHHEPNNTILEFIVVSKHKKYGECRINYKGKRYSFIDGRLCYLSAPFNMKDSAISNIKNHIMEQEESYIRSILRNIKNQGVVKDNYEIIGYKNDRMVFTAINWDEYTDKELEIMKNRIYNSYMENAVKISQ